MNFENFDQTSSANRIDKEPDLNFLEQCVVKHSWGAAVIKSNDHLFFANLGADPCEFERIDSQAALDEYLEMGIEKKFMTEIDHETAERIAQELEEIDINRSADTPFITKFLKTMARPPR